ncbi:MAG: hypothetical protein GX755_10140 [Syntrophomonadaceae bacterium]|nr:hypothetical protein [Syntrophomonadaceae bacterium]
MIHYTPLDPRIIWTDPNEAAPIMEERVLNGVRVLLRQDEGQLWSVVKVISTNPDDFLRPELQPGHFVQYTICAQSDLKTE